MACCTRDALYGASLVILLTVVLGCPNSEPEKQVAEPKKPKSAVITNVGTNSAKIAAARRAAAKRQEADTKKPFRVSPELLQTLMETAAETGNRAAIRDLAEKCKANPDPKVRMDCVEALFSVDREGIVALTDFVNDPNEEVSQRAADMLETQLEVVEDAYLRTELVGKVAMAAKNEDNIRNVLSRLENVPPDYAVRKIIDLIEREKTYPVAAKIAKEEYEAITGEKFRSLKDAHRWARMAER